MSDSAPTARPGLRAGVEPWMISNLAIGAAVGGFLTLLVPPFVAAVTGNPSRAGIVMALVSLAAVVGPVVGKWAAATGRYRTIYLGAMLLLAASFVLLAVDATTWRWSPIFGIIFGASYAAQGTLAPAFIVGSGQPADTVAAQLTALNLAFPLGQVLGSIIIAIAQGAGAPTATLFWISAATMLALTLATWSTINQPVERLRQAEQSAQPAADTEPAPTPSPGWRTVLISAFGTFLLVVVFSSIGSNGLTSQLANVMPAVYGFSPAGTSLLLAVAGLLNIFAIIYAGHQMTARSPRWVFDLGTIIRTLGALAMALVGLATNPVLVLAAVAMLVTYQGVPLPRVVAPDLAANLAPTPAAVADGYYFAASALGSVVGCLLAGYLADVLGYNAINWLAATAGAIAVAIILAGAHRRSAAAQDH